MATWLAAKPAIMIAGEWRTSGKGPHDDVEVRVAYSLLHAEALALFLSGVTIQQFRVTRRKEDWLVMVKGTRGQKKLIAWFVALTWRDALTLVATSLDSGAVDWLTDTPPPWST